MKRVQAKISRNGQVALEFVGFRGEQCKEDLEEIQDLLLRLGVELDQVKIQFKSGQEIAQEVRSRALRSLLIIKVLVSLRILGKMTH